MVAVGVMMAPALAQETMETVVVTGIRASLQSAQSIKQNSDQVVDSITAVDIGALPDRSVAEALQRVPGVQITRTDQNRDPVRWAGYGNGVFVRGLSWVNALTNGLATFGAENGRTLSFADVSADLMAGVDVYKNPDAKMIEGGVGGTVDLRTRKPFDQDGLVVAASTDLSYGDLNDHIAPSANILVSNRWNTRVGEVGVLLSADYQDLRAGTNVYSLGDYSAFCLSATSSATGTCATNPTITNGSTIQLPYQGGEQALSYRHMDWKQPRIALYGALQWRPSEKLEIGAWVMFSKAEPQSVEHVATWGLPADTASLNNYTYDASGVFTGTKTPIANDENLWGGQDTRFGVRHHINAQYVMDVKWTPNDRWEVSGTASYSDSRATMYDMTMYTKMFSNHWTNGSGVDAGTASCLVGGVSTTTSTGAITCDAGSTLTENYNHPVFYPNAPVVNVMWNGQGGHPVISYTGDLAGMIDPAQYTWGAAMDHLENNYAHNFTTRADATYTAPGDGIFGLVKSVAVGFRADLRQALTRQSNWNWGAMNFQTWYVWDTGGLANRYGNNVPGAATGGAWGSGSGLNNADFIAAVGNLTNSIPNQYSIYTFNDFYGRNAGTMIFPKVSLVSSSEQAIEAVIHGYDTAWNNSNTWVGGLWHPLAIKNGCGNITSYKCQAVYNNTAPSATSQTGGQTDQKENTFAGYLQLNYAHDTFLGYDVPVDGNIGVRIVATEDDSGVGYLLLPATTNCANPATCPDVIQGNTFIGAGGIIKAAPVTHNYVNILPSFNFRAHLTDTLQARAAYSQQIVRPDFAYTQNYTSLSFNYVTDTVTNITSLKSGTNGTGGNGGNPALKPLMARNYDISLEWYFAPTGSLSLAMFHKDISNYVLNGIEKDTFTRNGLTYDFYVNRYMNGDHGKVEGFELAYQQFYDSLPGAWGGLGLQANYTKIYNSGGSNPSYNIADPTGTSNANDKSLPMEGMSHDSFNVALLYAKYNIDARLAYNWRSGFLMTTSAANLNEPVWQGNFGQLDGSVIYSFMNHYKIGIQATNILKAQTVLQVGYANLHPNYEWVDADRKISLVLRANW